MPQLSTRAFVMPTFEMHGRQVRTRFGLVGTDEDALSTALAWCMGRNVAFLREALRLAGVAGLREADLQAARVIVQRHRVEGITDVEVIVGDRWHVIFEAKIGLNIPSADQLQRYLAALAASPAAGKRLALILGVDSRSALARVTAVSKDGSSTVAAVLWADLGNVARDVARSAEGISRDLLDFATFLEEEYRMRAYTDEVWIVAADTAPLWPGGLSFADTHLSGRRIYYRTDRTAVRPLYLALRFDGQVRAVQKVVGVDHDRCPIEYIPELRHVAEPWPRTPHTIWRLGEPVPLPRAIPTGDPKMQARHVYCDFVDLLTGETVRQIERTRSHDRAKQAGPPNGRIARSRHELS